MGRQLHRPGARLGASAWSGELAGSGVGGCCGPIRSAGEYRSLGARQISIDLPCVWNEMAKRSQG
eukprot:COSAG06_NODE_9562_length_1870_cov_1.624506_2_plen_65_part_00